MCVCVCVCVCSSSCVRCVCVCVCRQDPLVLACCIIVCSFVRHVVVNLTIYARSIFFVLLLLLLILVVVVSRRKPKNQNTHTATTIMTKNILENQKNLVSTKNDMTLLNLCHVRKLLFHSHFSIWTFHSLNLSITIFISSI